MISFIIRAFDVRSMAVTWVNLNQLVIAAALPFQLPFYKVIIVTQNENCGKESSMFCLHSTAYSSYIFCLDTQFSLFRLSNFKLSSDLFHHLLLRTQCLDLRIPSIQPRPLLQGFARRGEALMLSFIFFCKVVLHYERLFVKAYGEYLVSGFTNIFWKLFSLKQFRCRCSKSRNDRIERHKNSVMSLSEITETSQLIAALFQII